MLKAFTRYNLKTLRVYTSNKDICSCKSKGSCPTPGKHPAPWPNEPNKGVYNARVETEEALFEGYNIAVACGGESRLMIVDVDPRNGGHLTWHEICSGHKIPETLEVQTGGGGVHIYFIVPKDMNVRNLSFEGVDFQWEGKYCIAPPSKHPSGGSYVWTDCDPEETEIATIPQWLVEWLSQKLSVIDRATNKGQCKQVEPEIGEWEFIHEILENLSPDIGYDNWLGVGMGLHATGAEDALDIWINWSKKDLKKFKEGECEAKWKSFSSISGSEIRTYRWIFAMADLYNINYGTGLEKWASSVTIKESSHSISDLIEQSGPLLLGLYDDCMAHAHRQIPEFAFGASIQVLSSLVQCAYSTQSDGLNLYSWFAAPAGLGKDGYFKWIKSIVTTVNSNIICGSVGSVQGLRIALAAYNSRLLCQDEFHDEYLQMTHSKNEFLKALGRDYKELWNIPKVSMPIVVKTAITPGSEWPSLSLAAFSTVRGLEACMDENFLSSGLGSRFLFWRQDGEGYVPRRTDVVKEHSQSLVEELKSLNRKGHSQLQDQLSQWDEISRIQEELGDKKRKRVSTIGKAKIVPRFTIGVEGEWLAEELELADKKAFEMRHDEAVWALYQRVGQIAQRLGALRAISHNRDTMTRDDYLWGKIIITININNITKDLTSKQSVTVQDDEAIKRKEQVLRVLLNAREEAPVLLSFITRRVRMKPQNVADSLIHLIILGQVECFDKSGRRIYPQKLESGYRFSAVIS